jgi:hypothetical protein
MHTPTYLQDAQQLLSEKGFNSTGTWYHGTSSALLDNIRLQGLRGAGDTELNKKISSTMATIGNRYSESEEPVFLTQSKELAYYWAEQRVRERSLRFEGEEKPVVLCVTLPEKQRQSIRPDVGGRTLLLMDDGEQFMAHVAHIYQRCGLDGPDIDLMHAGRMEFQDKLGMAYIDQDIDSLHVQLVQE